MYNGIKSYNILGAIALVFCSTGAYASTLDTIQYRPSESYVHLISGFTADQQQVILDRANLNLYLIIGLTLIVGLLLWSWYYHYTAHQKMKNLNAELHEYINSNIKLEQFAHIASHDLKSPLRTVLSYTGLLKKKLNGQTNPDIDRYLAYIKNGAEQMDNLTSDLLDFAKVNSMVINKERFKTREMIQDVLDILEYNIRTKKAQIIISNLPEYMLGDRQKLQRVVHNLLSNSLKFTDEGTVPEIEITCRQQKDNFVFSFSDNGIGIAKKFQRNIFDSFSKLNTDEKYKGTGLGLTMAKKIMNLHDGDLQLKSYEGYGSTFSFSLPRYGEEIAYDAKRELVA